MEQLTLPNTTTYMMWYDPEKKIKLKQKINDALEHYQDTRGKPATLILTNPEHVVEAQLAAPEIAIEGRSYIGRFLFYVGEE